MVSATKPTVIELFCGAGGTSYGFHQAGFDVRLGLDINEQAAKTFALNHPTAEVICDSVENVTGAKLLSRAGLNSVDVLVGGPSCQGYSTIGPRLDDDPRNLLFKHYLRLVAEIRPRWIVFENVRGMKFHGKGKFFKQLCQELTDLGYRTTNDILNAADYGVPQRRERLIVIGTCDGVKPVMPAKLFADPRCTMCSRPDGSKRVRGGTPTEMFGELRCPRCDGSGIEPERHQELPRWVSVWDAIGDLPVLGDKGGSLGFTPYESEAFSEYQRLMRLQSEGYTLHKARPVSRYAHSIIDLIPEGKGIRAIPEEQLPDRFKIMRKISTGSLRRDCTTLYHRLSRLLPSYTITCSFTNVASGAFVHPLANRAITIREAARLQSFPDCFVFSDSGLKDQIGNAVPPLLAQKIANQIQVQMETAQATKQDDILTKEQPAEPRQPDPGERQGSLALQL